MPVSRLIKQIPCFRNYILFQVGAKESAFLSHPYCSVPSHGAVAKKFTQFNNILSTLIESYISHLCIWNAWDMNLIRYISMYYNLTFSLLICLNVATSVESFKCCIKYWFSVYINRFKTTKRKHVFYKVKLFYFEQWHGLFRDFYVIFSVLKCIAIRLKGIPGHRIFTFFFFESYLCLKSIVYYKIACICVRHLFIAYKNNINSPL